jgi:hypothetical protein
MDLFCSYDSRLELNGASLTLALKGKGIKITPRNIKRKEDGK